MEKKKPNLFVIRKQVYFTKPFIVHVDIKPTSISLKYIKRIQINDKIIDFDLFTCYLDIYELRKRNDWKSHSRFGVHLKDYDAQALMLSSKIIDDLISQGMTNKEDIEKILILHSSRPGTVNRHGYLINSTAYVQNSKPFSVYEHALLPDPRIFAFYLKFEDSYFDEIMVNISIDRYAELESNCNEIQINNTSELRTTYKDDEFIQDIVWLPTFELSTDKNFNDGFFIDNCCKPNEYKTIYIRMINEHTKKPIEKSEIVYLENINGYLPKNRIKLNSLGEGSFKFYANGLDSGDIMTVKAGFKYFTNKDELTINVEC